MTAQQERDQLALQALARAYCHGIDRRDFALVRSLYHDDGEDHHGSMFQGSADFVAWLPEVMAGWQATSHTIATMNFLIDGDAAEGELAFTAYHRTLALPQQEMTSAGRYLDRYVRRGGVWRIWRRHVVRDWSNVRPVSPWASGSSGEGSLIGRPGGDDPCFTHLPMFAAQYGGGRGVAAQPADLAPSASTTLPDT